MLKTTSLFLISYFLLIISYAQPDRWQQRIKYVMDAKLDIKTNKVTGKQTITYYNNSPDTLTRVFMHTYWNAFQPNSMMDVRSRELGKTVLGNSRNGNPILDWDTRVKDRIVNLNSEQIGYCNVTSIKIKGEKLDTKEHETILEVLLNKPILPKSSVVFTTNFECQVPIQIRRSGRNSAENIAYSMSQWYPKMVEYDYTGWNANPYVAREFYGVWGDYDVSISIDKNFKLGGTGILQNANEIGWGYDKEGTVLKSIATPNRIWHFKAENVHDFVWAADPEYKHITKKPVDGPLLHFIYKQVDSVETNWQATAETCAKAYPFMAKTFGPYPYPSYSFIQGGDGGMEYPMATLIKNASIGSAIHEWCHSWYQGMLGTNESLYPWMDEGFTTYAELRTSGWLRNVDGPKAFTNAYSGYFNLVQSPFDEAAITHADHFNTNFGYSQSSYSRGAVFLEQLGYIVGQQTLDKILLNYYNQWRFKHPNPDDFIRVAEKVSGMELDWYKQYLINSTKLIDYKIDSLWQNGSETNIRLARQGKFPMPIDAVITFKDGSRETHYIPLGLMYGEKPAEDSIPRKVYPEWKWTHADYIISTKRKLKDVVKIEIDPSQRLADIDRKNNVLELKW